jgi:hypothetical protein
MGRGTVSGASSTVAEKMPTGKSIAAPNVMATRYRITKLYAQVVINGIVVNWDFCNSHIPR